MKTMKHFLIVAMSILFVLKINAQEENEVFIWNDIEKIPNEMGLNGSFVGVHNEALIIAGGANFPDVPVWEGGKKKWYDSIYVLEKNGDSNKWVSTNIRLPRPLAYGVSLNTSKGVLCIGGNNEEGIYSDVYLLKWNENSKTVEIENLPPLPMPLANMSGDQVGDVVYIIGGQEKMGGETTTTFLSFSLTQDLLREAYQWKVLPDFPGKGRMQAVVVGQNNGVEDCLYVFSGLSYNPSSNSSYEMLDDVYEYNPHQKNWTQKKSIPGNNTPGVKGGYIGAAPAIKMGGSHILIFGGAGGKQQYLAQRLEIGEEIQSLKKSTEAEGLKLEKIAALEVQGKELLKKTSFTKTVWAYHTITDTWSKKTNLPNKGQVVTKAVKWQEGIVIPGGEISPGVRTNKILKVAIETINSSFGFLNVMVLVVYFGLLIWMGYYFSKRQKNTDDYFKGGGRVPWWAAGLSIFGTGLSAITFMAIPAKAYATDWAYMLFNGGVLLMAPFIVYKFIPVFRQLNITSAYQYLEMRFNVALRIMGSLSFIFFQIGRMAVVLFLPAIALNVVTGVDIYMCILGMGLLSLLYTLMGGIEAVIWTDAMQVVVLMGGAVLCLVLMLNSVEGGFSGVVETAVDNHKFNVFNTAFDFKQPTLWVVLISGFFSSLATYGTDQTMVQRYLTTSDKKGAVKGLMTNVWLTIPATLIFFFVGTALYAFFKQHPENLNIGLSNGDAIFPWYIVKELPDGVVGVLISGILAAAMSSVSSSMNSAATAYSVDIHFRFFKDSNSLRLARVITLVIGGLGTAVALFMAGFEIKSLWDVFNKVLGLIIGSMAGLFLLGMYFKRANATGAIVGFVGSLVIQLVIASNTNLHLLLYTATGMVSCFAIGAVSSLLSTQK